MTVLQIVPRVPPHMCGIGDYAWNLALELRAAHGIECSFLSAGTNWTAPAGETEFPVSRLPKLSSGALVEYLQGEGSSFSAMVLHVSLYGYQRRAVPFWLAGGMERVARHPEHPKIIMMFHELYSSGSMKTSAFWLQPLQKIILRRLARLGDVLRTNRQPYANWLESVSNRRSPAVTVMPVFSNFGEMVSPPPLSERPPDMVMFGSGIHGGRDAAASLREAVEIAAPLGIKRLHVLGVGAGPPEKMQSVEILRHPPLPQGELSALLAGCRLAYNGYHPLYLGKSTILAGYAAHGLAVVQAGTDLPEILPDGLRLGKELVSVKAFHSGQAPDGTALQAAATRLHAWYEPHSLAKNAESYVEDILKSWEQGALSRK